MLTFTKISSIIRSKKLTWAEIVKLKEGAEVILWVSIHKPEGVYVIPYLSTVGRESNGYNAQPRLEFVVTLEQGVSSLCFFKNQVDNKFMVTLPPWKIEFRTRYADLRFT